ncbi:MAG: sulfur transferase domain-containing protein [Geminicoccaceae bacterium]
MSAPHHLSEKVAIGGQPTVEDLHELRAQGFVAVVNLCTTGEAGQQLSPEAEAFAAQELGLAYSHVPAALAELDPRHVHRLRAAIDAAGGPVYVHCGAGQRACALSLMALHPRPAEDLVVRAERLGLPVTEERPKDFVRLGSNRAGWDLLQSV